MSEDLHDGESEAKTRVMEDAESAAKALTEDRGAWRHDPCHIGPNGERVHPNRHWTDGIPCLTARGHGLAEAWENSMLELYRRGCVIDNQYEDKLGKDHPLSIDATMMIVVEDPLADPCVHRCFPGGLEDLEEYRLEFVEGVKDHWVKDPSDPDYSGEWTYTYSQRFKRYEAYVRGTVDVGGGALQSRPIKQAIREFKHIDQVAHAIESLSKSPHSRRVKLVTWQPWLDPYTPEPPCLCEFWLRCSQVPWMEGYILNGNAVFRSRDAFDAAFMNLWGEAAFMEKTAGELQVRLGKPVKVGRLCDLSHSYHIYGKRRQVFEDLFLKQWRERTFADRTWTREEAQPFFDEAGPKVFAKIKARDEEVTKRYA